MDWVTFAPGRPSVVTADALHTQTETARYLVEDKKSDYVFTVKDNQPMLKQDMNDLHLEVLFSPQRCRGPQTTTLP